MLLGGTVFDGCAFVLSGLDSISILNPRSHPLSSLVHPSQFLSLHLTRCSGSSLFGQLRIQLFHPDFVPPTWGWDHKPVKLSSLLFLHCCRRLRTSISLQSPCPALYVNPASRLVCLNGPSSSGKPPSIRMLTTSR